MESNNRDPRRQLELGEMPAPAPERRLPPLQGSEKQVAWAEQIRARLLREMYRMKYELRLLARNQTERGAMEAAAAEAAAATERRVRLACSIITRLETTTSCRWWIDQHEQSAEDLMAEMRL